MTPMLTALYHASCAHSTQHVGDLHWGSFQNQGCVVCLPFAVQVGLTCVAAAIVGALFRHLEYDLEGVHNRTGVIWFSIVYFSLAATSSLGVLQIEVGTSVMCTAQAPPSGTALCARCCPLPLGTAPVVL